MSLVNDLAKWTNIYLGLPLFIGGTLGNLLHIVLLWRNRRNSCAFLFLFCSLMNCIVLFYGLFLRVLSDGFNSDWSTTNRIWCKTRVALTPITFLISLTCLCLASTDRFFASCRQEKYRKFSRLSLAISAVILTNIFWLGNFIPYFVYADLVRNPTIGLTSCVPVRNEAYTNYIMYFALPIYYGLLPSTILTVTGILTYKNVSRLQIINQRRSLQRQLTSMMLIQIPIILSSTLPYVTFTQYTILTSKIMKTAERRSIELLITNIVTNVCYTAFACPFYASLASSKAFRKEAKALFLCRKINSVRPIQVQPNVTK